MLGTAAVLLPMLLVWYPRPLFEAAGTARLPCFVAVVTFLLGPLVAFVAARRGRPHSRAQTRKIAIAQAVAIAGCALALYVQRPVYLVFTVDRFDLVLARDLSPLDLAKAGGEFARRPLGAPEYVAAVPPADPREAQRILDIALDGGKDLQAYPQHYVRYESRARDALKHAKPLGTLGGREAGPLNRYLEASGRAPSSLRFLPLRARKRDGIVLLDADSGLPLQVLLVEPW